MVALEDLAVALPGLVAIAAVSGLVFRDARRVDVGRPRLWAGIVGASCGLALGLYLLVPTIPRPGLLVIVLFGPVFYLFERDDAKHGDEPADPHVLAHGTTESDDDETRSSEESASSDAGEERV